MTHITTSVSFCDVQFFAVWMPATVQPALIVKANGVHDERLIVPSADGIPEPGRELNSLKLRPAVAVDLTWESIKLVNHERQTGCFDDLERL